MEFNLPPCSFPLVDTWGMDFLVGFSLSEQPWVSLAVLYQKLSVPFQNGREGVNEAKD